MSREGWICPKCERCLSPDVKVCPTCEPAKLTVSVPFVQIGDPPGTVSTGSGTYTPIVVSPHVPAFPAYSIVYARGAQ